MVLVAQSCLGSFSIKNGQNDAQRSHSQKMRPFKGLFPYHSLRDGATLPEVNIHFNLNSLISRLLEYLQLQNSVRHALPLGFELTTSRL